MQLDRSMRRVVAVLAVGLCVAAAVFITRTPAPDSSARAAVGAASALSTSIDSLNAIVAAIVFSLISVLPLLPAPFHSPAWLALMFLAGLLGWALFSGQVALFAILAPTSVPLAVSLNLSAVSVGAAIAALIGGLVIDLFGAGAIGVTAAACALLGLGLAFAYRETLSGQR